MTGVQSPFPGDIEIASKADQERVSVAQFLWRLRISDRKGSARDSSARARPSSSCHVQCTTDRSADNHQRNAHFRASRDQLCQHDCDFRKIFLSGRSLGGQVLVVKFWWSSFGGQVSAVKFWWSSFGGQVLVAES
jgi:hypothetical protein